MRRAEWSCKASWDVKFSQRAHNAASRRYLYRPPWESRWALVKILATGLLVSMIAGWAVVHHWTHVMPPLRVPVTPTNAGVDGSEMAAPDLVESDP